MLKNFGHNVSYSPKHFYEPTSEKEVLTILDKHKKGHVRVQSTGHSWSEIVEADDVLVNMRHFNAVTIEKRTSGPVAKIGAGAVLQTILNGLHSSSPYTLPTMGAIKRQTIAGATATATHGTGNTSLSNFVKEIKLACYDTNGNPCIKTINSGDELLAARASLGCMGIILELVIEIVPNFWMEEILQSHENLPAILKEETEWPQQQFFVLPYAWRWYAFQRRKIIEPGNRAKMMFHLQKLYDFLFIEVGLHTSLKMAFYLEKIFGKEVITFYWQHLVPIFLKPRRVLGESEKIMTLHTEHHYFFRHVEMELFIPKEHIENASIFMQEAIPYFAGIINQLSERMIQQLNQIDMLQDYKNLSGTYVHHYILFFRHILAEDTLIAMNQGSERYSMSFFTFQPPHLQKPYYEICNFLARTFAKLFSARPHWGKYNPLTYHELEPLYPRLNDFRDICKAHDPDGVFQNAYTKRVLG